MKTETIGILSLGILVGCVFGFIFGHLSAKERKNISIRPTMDNYSFAVGVWCTKRVMNPTGWQTNYEVLHDARHFSQTNGWLQFNNRDGFRGDE